MWIHSPYKQDFIGIENKRYFNTAAEGLLLKDVGKSLLDYIYDKSLGVPGRIPHFKKHDLCRKAVGELLGVSPETIAFLGNSSEAIGLIANSLDLKNGDEVVLTDIEFPSGLLSFLRLRETKGIVVKIVRHEDWNISEEMLQKAITNKTRVVYLSEVSYKNGFRFNIQRIAEIAHRVGAYFIVDATQALGRIPVSVVGVDFMMSSTFKWLCSTHGIGITYCNPSLLEQLKPDRVGWWSVIKEFETGSLESYTLKPDAIRMEAGQPNFPALYALHTALQYLMKIGIATIQEELEPVGMRLCEGLKELGVKLITPLDKDAHAGIFAFAHQKSDEIVGELEKQNIHVWSRLGRVRIAIHLYNDMEDVEILLKALAPLIKKYS